MAIDSTLYDFAVRHSWHRLSRMYNQRALEHDITIPIGFILMIVEKEGTPSTQLGPKMGMEPTSLSRTLKTMEDKGYIIRTEDKKDKRKVLISLTEAGVSMRKIVKDFIIGFNDKIATSVTPKKMAVFLEVINQVDELIDEEYKTLNLQ